VKLKAAEIRDSLMGNLLTSIFSD